MLLATSLKVTDTSADQVDLALALTARILGTFRGAKTSRLSLSDGKPQRKKSSPCLGK